MDNQQPNFFKNIIIKLEKFKEEGSTTKWFSGDLLIIDFANLKINNSS